VPAVYILFIALAYFSYIGLAEFLSGASYVGLLVTLFAIGIFVLFVRLGRKLEIHFPILPFIFAFSILILYLASMRPVVVICIALGYVFLLKGISRLSVERLIFLTFLFSFSSFLFISSKGIPLFDASAREALAFSPLRALFHSSVFASVLIMAYKKKSVLIFFLAFLAVLLGLKSDAIAILVSAGIVGLLLGKISFKETLIGIGLVILILSIVGVQIAKASYVWNIPPLFYIFYRAGFTFSVFDKIAILSLPLGITHGKAFLSPTQEIVSTEVLGYEIPHSITSTLIGPITLDFGILGLVGACIFLGIYLGAMQKMSKNRIQVCCYAVALTQTFLLVEIGLQLTSVLYYLTLLYIASACKIER
jgi:hypothetical protein